MKSVNTKKHIVADEETDSDEEDTFCLVCLDRFSNSASKEKWIQCTECHMWAHEKCTDGDNHYVCHNCTSDED